MPIEIIKVGKKLNLTEFSKLEFGDTFRSTHDNDLYLKIRDLHVNFARAICLSTFNIVDFTKSLRVELIKSQIVMETE